MNKKYYNLLHGFAKENNFNSYADYQAGLYANNVGKGRDVTLMLDLMEFIAYVESKRKGKV